MFNKRENKMVSIVPDSEQDAESKLNALRENVENLAAEKSASIERLMTVRSVVSDLRRQIEVSEEQFLVGSAAPGDIDALRARLAEQEGMERRLLEECAEKTRMLSRGERIHRSAARPGRRRVSKGFSRTWCRSYGCVRKSARAGH